MARILIVGCGARGRALAGALRGRGHAVRGTTRAPGSLAAIEAAGAEAVLADPDRVATLVPAFDRVTVVCLLLGSATGPDEQVAALHSSRLAMILTKLVDTTVRGVLYEAAGTAQPGLLAAGSELVRGHCECFRVPYALLSEPLSCAPEALPGAVATVEELL